MDWYLLSPFDLSRILLVGGDLSVPSSLPGPPVVTISHASGYYLAWPGRVVSVSVSPNISTLGQAWLVYGGHKGEQNQTQTLCV